MAVKEKQFVELEFTGKVKDTGEIFDTTNPKDAKAMGMKNEAKPLKICVGEGMLPEKFDKALVGKETGKEYSIELSPKEAFGDRKSELIKTIPLRIFTEKNVMPYKGMMLNLDGMLVRVVSVSGGRVIADFNNPLAGKNILYEFRIIRSIEDKKGQADAFIEAFLRLDSSKLDVKIEGNKAVAAFDVKDDEFKFYEEIFKSLSEKARSLLDLEFELKNKNSPEKSSEKK